MERIRHEQTTAERLSQSAEALLQLVRSHGYHQLVLMVDRDGVILPEDLVQAARQRASFETKVEYYLKVSLRTVRPNPLLTLFLDQCNQIGIQVCPGSRTDWLFSNSEIEEAHLHHWWLKFHERFSNSQTFLSINKEGLQISGFAENPFIIFISNDFSESQKFTSTFESLFKSFRGVCSDFQSSTDFFIMPVPSYGKLALIADQSRFSNWLPNYDFDQELLQKLKQFFRINP
ncbi:MAG: hypothetical protein XD95_0035 [Microgenomates bacterium 39_7]|nr:MAG: hypothetical protein XD95_0035 [Microgenomates bacterium 39_7]